MKAHALLSLLLPEGLDFVDDLDGAENGWVY